MKSAPLPLPHLVLRICLCLVTSGLLLAAAYVLVADNGGAATLKPLNVPLEQIKAVAGKVHATPTGVSIEAYQDASNSHYAILSWQQTFSAQDYSLLAYQLASGHPAPILQLGWRRKDDLATIHSAVLSLSGETTPLTTLHDHPEWHGDIVEMGLHVTAQSADHPFELASLQLLPSSASGELRAKLSAWQHFKSWTHFSINQLYAGLNEQKPNAVHAAAAWAGLALLLALAWQSLSGVVSIATLCGVVLVPWLALDTLWQKNLSAQLQQTKQLFSGKTLEEKHQADQDNYIYEFARELNDNALPAAPARILMLYVKGGHQFERLRLQYYLLPHNIYNFNSLPTPGQEHRVDYVIIIGDKLPSGIWLQKRTLVQGKRKLPLELVKSGSMGHLFRIDHDAIQADQ